VWNAFIGLLNALLIFLLVEIAFRAEITMRDPLLFFIALVITLMSLASIGLVFSAFFVLTRSSFVLTRMLEFPIYVACGAMFPVTVLPEWSRPISYALAPSWGVNALRASAIEGYPIQGLGYAGDLLIVVLLTLAYLLIAFYLFSRMERKAMVDGTLGRY